METFNAAYAAWQAGADMRARRQRFKNYTYGNQWADIVPGRQGSPPCTEGEAITNTGRKPLTNNLIHRLVKAIVGRWRSMPASASVYAGGQKFIKYNELEDIDARLLEEFLISGVAVQRIGRTSDGRVTVDNVMTSDFFVNVHSDTRGRDVELLGMLHSLPLSEVVRRFCGGNASKASVIRRIYAGLAGTDAVSLATGSSALGVSVAGGEDFFRAPDVSSGAPRCRVVEVWSRRSADVYLCHDRRDARAFAVPVSQQKKIDSENRRRRRNGEPRIEARFSVQTVWYYTFYAPTGEVLAEGVSPYPHHGHPFVFRFYPLTDGEVHPFVEGLVDQQKYINRLIVSIDHTMQTSAKGVLLFPEQQLVSGWTLADVAREWSACDGVIPVRGGEAEGMPRQVVASSGDPQAYRLLDIQMKLFDQISGVPEALLGRQTGATGAELYNAQVENATSNLTDIFRTFAAMLMARNAKAVSLESNNY